MFWKRSPLVSYLVAGLGNPGGRYAMTRHNAGFRVIRNVMIQAGKSPALTKNDGGYLCARVKIGPENVLLIQPLTFMNRSGGAVAAALKKNRLLPENLLVVYDDLDLQPGALRIKPQGGSGGHRGIKSIQEAIGVATFARLRVGIGRPGVGEEVQEYVLGIPPSDEAELLAEAEKLAAGAVIDIIKNGLDYAMNNYNSRLNE